MKTIEGLKGAHPLAGDLRHRRGRAVRHLHARDDPRRGRAAEERDARGDPARPRGKSLPLHRIRGDLPRDPKSCEENEEGRRMNADSNEDRCAPPSLLSQLLEPRSLAEALRMLRDEGPARASRRLHRHLREPELRHAAAEAFPEPLAARRAAQDRDAARRALDRRARDVHADDPICARSQAAADPRRGVAGGRGRRRSRIAGRSEATSPTLRPRATRCPSWQPPRRFSS